MSVVALKLNFVFVGSWSSKSRLLVGSYTRFVEVSIGSTHRRCHGRESWCHDNIQFQCTTVDVVDVSGENGNVALIFYLKNVLVGPYTDD